MILVGATRLDIKKFFVFVKIPDESGIFLYRAKGRPYGVAGKYSSKSNLVKRNATFMSPAPKKRRKCRTTNAKEHLLRYL